MSKLDVRAIVRTLLARGALCAVVLGSVSCGDVVRQGRAPVLMVVDSIQAASGAEPENLSGFLLSDVRTNGSIFNDIGQATLRLVNKDQGSAPGLGTVPSTLNAVTLHRYHIAYKRADGRDKPENYGKDVPYPVDGGVTATLTNSPVTVSFEMVRHQAKLESPLLALAGLGGRIFISTIAEITFFGRDQVGNDVQITGSISVSFADYADPTSSGGGDGDDGVEEE
jgi:hypothetical protein